MSMKFRPNKHYTGIAIYAFLVIAAAMLLFFAIQNISLLSDGVGVLFDVIQPLVIGFVFAYLLNPILRLYDDRFLRWISRNKLKPKARRTIALLLTYPTALVFLAAILALIIPQLASSVYSLFGLIPDYVVALQGLYTSLLSFLGGFELVGQGPELDTVFNGLIGSFTSAMQGLLENAYIYLTDLVPGIISAGARFTTGLLDFVLGVIISIYLLFDREKLFAQTKKLSVAILPERAHNLLYELLVDANRIFGGFITGKIIDSVIIGILCFISMSILQMPFTVLISVIVGVTNVIPYFGPIIGAIPGAFIILIVSPKQALIFVIFIIVLQQFDGNILGPKILGDSTGLSALWVIFAITLFSGIFGVPGMFIGVPLFALLYSIVRRVTGYLLKKRSLSVNTEDYDSEQNPLT
jgi:predicted PurR-regulated permease PerM